MTSTPGPNPTIMSNNASAVKIYSKMCTFSAFRISYTLKNALAYYNAGVVHICKHRSRRIGPRFFESDFSSVCRSYLHPHELDGEPLATSPGPAQLLLGSIL
jgi:hypothetical protein